MTRILNSLDQNSEVDHVLEVSKSTMIMVISNSDHVIMSWLMNDDVDEWLTENFLNDL